jgi:type II secretory pathway pseudopilin PulG
MVSIMVTMIMMIVISLIVLGFAQVSRREQRESLDRQLSTQAFFAAESAVNDARSAVTADIAAGGDIAEKSTCPTSTSDANYPFNPVLDSADDVSYTCLLVTSKLTTLTSTLSAAGSSVNLPFDPDGTASTMHINWTAATTPNVASVANCPATIPASGDFSVTSNWKCPYGVLRVDIVPTDILSQTALEVGQKTFFLYPTNNSGSGSQDYTTAKGVVTAMYCTTSGCNIDITNLPPATATYALRLSAVYVGGSFLISAKDAGGNSLELKNAQVQVDATGKAQDVLRRIQVRLPLQPSGNTPDYALESASSVCKRFEINSTEFIIPNDIKGQDPNNPTCIPLTVGNAGGNADIGVNPCDDLVNGNCVPNPLGSYHWTQNFTNTSQNPDDQVVGCEWSWTDGTAKSVVNQACDAGNVLPITFATRTPLAPYPQDCNKYNIPITLAINLNNGQTATYTYSTNDIPICY